MTTDHDSSGHTDGPVDGDPDEPSQSIGNDISVALNQILETYMANTEQQIDQARRTLAIEVLPALQGFGVSNIEIAYSGYGDSGAIDGVQYRDAAGLRVVRDNIPQGIREKLETCVYAFLPAGFEINDGSQGTLTIDLPTRKITLQHEQNEVVAQQSSREWEV